MEVWNTKRNVWYWHHIHAVWCNLFIFFTYPDSKQHLKKGRPSHLWTCWCGSLLNCPMQKILLVLTVTNETRLLCISAQHVVGCLCYCDCRIVCFSIILEWIIFWHLHCGKSHRVAIILKWFQSVWRFCEWHVGKIFCYNTGWKVC